MTVIRGDARRLPLADASVDLVITSPPYFALRSYTDNGQHYTGQIGSEATPQEYIAALVECTREWVRVLKPGGSIWVNLGDKYAGGSGGGAPSASSTLAGNGHVGGGPKLSALAPAGPVKRSAMPSKSLLLLPERYRIACVDELGLIARAVVIWSKPNGLPESVQDRVRRSHEDWVHLVRQPRYYSAVDHIREAHSPHTLRYYGPGTTSTQRPANAKSNEVNPTQHRLTTVGALGKLPGSVWTVPTEPLTVPAHLGVDHFAAFPMEWPRRLVAGWSPSGVCTGCGQGRRPVSEASYDVHGPIAATDKARQTDLQGNTFTTRALGRATRSTAITGEVCSCPDTTAPTRPAVVLDPFSGTGTTVLVARALGRIGVGVDMSADYCRLARWRTTDPSQLAKALRVEKPPAQAVGQLDLFGEVAS